MEKVTTFICYCIAVFMAWLGGLSPQDIAFLVGAVMGVATFFVNWYYRRKTYRLLQGMGFDRGVNDAINR
ncbi:MAG: phage holin family protein [Ewingella americana]|jgi:cell division protein FtsW (lipid II flippase)|uniref:phage holin n=1 Tax=Ewingella americana TaxID=41202 RepID=UPI0024301C0A|nr:phage holin [Ewingella americana]MCI1680045.1 phage holin family protein [Ewingella americana]MCI1855040.1 phage holin family protein [Ewingella americana]MCI1863517.1 phage holin family protein [Ewingella americana]MCI2143387.1 phage holin family protein [Ewingella americana]MCI2164544.1 phage holin family protein [Ewingella americana]